MASRFDLVSSRASVSRFDCFLNESTLKDAKFDDTLQSDNLGRGQTVRAWLKPTEMENEQYHLRKIRTTSPDSCCWLLNDETFQDWFDPQGTTAPLPRLLWLDGKPGAGKSSSRYMIQALSIPLLIFAYRKDRPRINNRGRSEVSKTGVHNPIFLL